MAKIKGNIVTEGLSGKVGQLVFRKRRGKTTAYVLSPSKKTATPKQEESRLRFAAAVTQARQALQNPAELKRFEQLAVKTGKESAYSAAISWFMGQPIA